MWEERGEKTYDFNLSYIHSSVTLSLNEIARDFVVSSTSTKTMVEN